MTHLLSDKKMRKEKEKKRRKENFENKKPINTFFVR
jgi:hypothetical protein